MGFHTRKIEKGVYGELSKIKEELEEAYDAEKQGQDLMLLIELADMIGAIEGVAKKYHLTVEQLLEFARLRSKVAIEELNESQNKDAKSPDKLDELIFNIWTCGGLYGQMWENWTIAFNFNFATIKDFISQAIKIYSNFGYDSFHDYVRPALCQMLIQKGQF